MAERIYRRISLINRFILCLRGSKMSSLVVEQLVGSS